jgi:hypothetical protein
MKCPVCKTPGAYVGLKEVECKNEHCQHYSARQAHLSAEEYDEMMKELNGTHCPSDGSCHECNECKDDNVPF